MDNRMRVLIVDDNVDFTRLLSEYMKQMPDIQVVGIASDGLTAVDMIQTCNPDIVILDIVMPNLDGIGVLERVNNLPLKNRPSFVMLTAIGQDKIVQNAIALGAEYYMIKPLDVDILVLRLRQIFADRKEFNLLRCAGKPAVAVVQKESKNEEADLENFICTMVKEYGVSPHMPGYRYIAEAIMVLLKNTKSSSAVTKVIYPAVAARFGTTPQRVERAIRNAIEIAWKKRLEGRRLRSGEVEKGKPTNSEFIAMLADRVRLLEK